MDYKQFELEILEWAHERPRFSHEELLARFPKLQEKALMDWYLSVFRGSTENDDCLIGLKSDGQGHYNYLTARGRSVFLTTQTINGKSGGSWFKKFLWEIVIGLVLAFLVFWLGWN